MYKPDVKCRLIEADGALNIRDLGGYATAGGGKLGYGRFIRAASLSNLTESGCETLRKLGVDCVVDLRSRAELRHSPDVNIGPNVKYEHVPLLDQIQSRMADGEETWVFPESMAEMYIGLLENNKADFKRVFEIFAGECKTFVFHCTAGKDRTGVTAMLLLGLMGVDEDVIVEDYSYSAGLLDIVIHPGIPAYLFESRPDTMRAAIGHIAEKYGGIRQYLRAAGIPEETLAAVKEKLEEKAGI